MEREQIEFELSGLEPESEKIAAKTAEQIEWVYVSARVCSTSGTALCATSARKL
jgi:hypothetical protein